MINNKLKNPKFQIKIGVWDFFYECRTKSIFVELLAKISPFGRNDKNALINFIIYQSSQCQRLEFKKLKIVHLLSLFLNFFIIKIFIKCHVTIDNTVWCQLYYSVTNSLCELVVMRCKDHRTFKIFQ